MGKTVITYGTFDLFHQGHLNILKKAKSMGDHLIVGVTSESFDIERGKLNVKDSLTERIKNIEQTGLADKIIVEEYQGQKINDVIKYNVDTFVIGSDWTGKFDYLKEYCEVVYTERTKGISSSQIRNEKGNLYRIGIATDYLSDETIISEAKFVSGTEIENVYSKDEETAEKFAQKYSLANIYTDYASFLKDIDIVYINTNLSDRYKLALEAIQNRKHVIAEVPVSLSKREINQIYKEAEENGVIFAENINLPYLRAFIQMIWLVQEGTIGDITRIDIKAKDAPKRLSAAAYMISKLTNVDMSSNFEYIRIKNDIRYILSKNNEILTTVELDSSPFCKDKATIYGTKGTVCIPNDWWNMGFFQINSKIYGSPKRYSFNFEGSGMRYLLHECLLSIESHYLKYKKEDTLIIANTYRQMEET